MASEGAEKWGQKMPLKTHDSDRQFAGNLQAIARAK
jgi:hypothetical protein